MTSVLVTYLVSCCLFFVPVFMLASALPKRSRFALRVAACCLVFVSYVGNPFAGGGGNTALVIAGLSIFFALYLVLLTLIVLFCFRANLRVAAFCATFGYTAQNLGAGLGELAGLLLRHYGIHAGNELLRSVVCSLAVYVVLYLVLVRKMRQQGIEVDPGRASFLLVFGVVFLNIVFDLTVKYLRAYNIPWGFSLILRMTVIVICLYALVLEYELLYNRRLLNEAVALQRIMHDQSAQYEMSKRNIDAINIKCHDIRHQIRHLQDGANTQVVDKDVLADIAHQVNVYDSAVRTGNDALDTILTEKSLLGEKDHIRLSCIVDGKALAFVTPTDAYALFGNALDNAFEAVRQLPEDEREISLQVREVAGMVTAHMENDFAGTVTFSNGLPESTKGDPANHGFGTKSMRAIVEKYGGTLTMGTDGNTFYLNILIPQP